MAVKSSFKKTEVGAIPDDWDVKLLPDVCRFRGGKAHEQYISKYGRYVCVNSKFIASDGRIRKFSTENFSPARKGDVLMVMSDLPNGRALAKAYLVEQDEIYAVNQRVCSLSSYRDCPEYIYYALNRNPYFLKFDDGVNQTHLLNRVFLNCPVALPPTLEEQRAIAAALSDVGSLLNGLERLITKKRDLKQATMQQLLTEEIRLPGFNGEWEVKRLADVADVIDPHPSHRAPDEVTNGVPFVGIGDLDEAGNIVGKQVRLVSPSVLDEHAYRYDLRDELIGLGRVASIGKVVSLKILDEGYAISPTIGVIRGGEAKRSYLVHALRSRFVTDQFSKIMSGSTRSSVGMEVLRELHVRIPPSEKEQDAIAAVLTDMEAEIAALQLRHDKTYALKQGMMQELLTGRTRLI
jgi:type I restriction enzyme S subunit